MVDIKYPAKLVEWRPVDSSNVIKVGWDKQRGMFVTYKSGAVYLYHDCSRQRAVACAYAPSVGKYIHENIKPNYACTRIT